MYPAWCEHGPSGTKYTATKSGWFDSFAFADWFKLVFLPWAKRLEGKKVLVGDNLSSHLSLEVISLCRENNIEFVCLPANSTDKMQPLDVGFFGPMKSAWRKQLRSYRKKDPAAKLLEKSSFPKMLKELLASLEPADLLPPAFERCGLYPLDPSKVTVRIPDVASTKEIARHVDEVLLKTLEVRRFGDKKKVPRGKKIPAGMSYSGQPNEEETSEEEEEEEEISDMDLDLGEQNEEELVDDVDSEGDDRRYSKKEKGKGKKVVSRKVVEVEQSEHSEQSGEEQWPEELPELGPVPVPVFATSSRIFGRLVVAMYEGEWFVGETVKEDPKDVPKGYESISYASLRGKNVFCWPEKKDVMLTVKEDILVADVTVEPKNSRGHFGLKPNMLKKVESLMVVVYFLNNEQFFVI